MATAKEAIYDEQVAPLMTQIIQICKTHKIAMLADFALGFEEDDDNQLKCTTALLEDAFEPPEEMLNAFNHLKPQRTSFFAITVVNGGI